MATDINFNPSQSAAVVAGSITPGIDAPAANQVSAQPILGGENVKVTSGAATDLEKLVAKLKVEGDNARADLTRVRLTAVTSALGAANVLLNKIQSEALATIVAKQTEINAMNSEIAGICAAYGIQPNGPVGTAMAMQVKISALEKAVERAVQEGKDHNAMVAKTKEQLDRDKAELARLENAQNKDNAKIQAARNAVNASQGAYDAAVALASGDAKKIADAQSAVAKAKTDAARVSALYSAIGTAESAVKAAYARIGGDKMGEISSVLARAADGADAPDERTSAAERKKEEEKEIANDPIKAIFDDLDRISAAISRMIEENQMVTA